MNVLVTGDGDAALIARAGHAPIAFRGGFFALVFTLLTRNVDIVHVNARPGSRGAIAALLAAKLCFVRSVYQWHGDGALPALAVRLADAVGVATTRQLKACTHPLAVLLPTAVEPRDAPRAANARLRLAFAGRLARDKGVYELLHALRLAKAHGTDATLVVAGDGPRLPALRRCAEELRVAGQVTFAPDTAGCDVFVRPSHDDGLPRELLQAMAAGMPVIATPVGALPDVLQDRVHALFVPVGNAEAMARAIATLDADRGLLAEMGEACRRRAADFSVDKVAAALARLYTAVQRRRVVLLDSTP